MPFQKPINSKKVKELMERWEARLVREGLAPASRVGNPYQSGSIGHDSITRQAKTQYYQMLSSHTANHNFDSKLDSFVMQRVAEGRSFVEVAKELKTIRKSRTPRTIGRIVRRYEKLWRIVR